MIYAYDTPLLMPTMDLYDKLVMAMAISAAKDVYDKSQEQMKDFYTKYGDFMSPFAKDMEAYGDMMGNISKVLDYAYENGIDLFKSPEGRQIVSRLSNSVNPRDYNTMRANAAMGYKYLEAVQQAKAKGEFDLEYEDWLLNQAGLGPFSNFSSAGGRMWDRPGPGLYKDINKWSSHLFDNMELSYDPELSKQYPGFMAYTKSKDTMNQIVDANIAGLLNTDLGRWRLQQIESKLPDGPGKHEAAIAELKRQVVDSNWEQGQIKLETDPYYLARYNANLSASKSSRSGNGSNNTKDGHDSAEGLFYRGLVHSGGQDYNQDLLSAIENARDGIVDRQVDLVNYAKTAKLGYAKTISYIIDNLSVEESPLNFAKYIAKPTSLSGSSTVVMNKEDVARLYSDGSIVSHMYGIQITHTDGRKPDKIYTDRSKFVAKDGSKVIARPTTRVVTSFTQRANGEYGLRQFWEVYLEDEEGNALNDGKPVYYELPTSRQNTTHMPTYVNYLRKKRENDNVIIRPNLREDPVTKGWKNTGSQNVNVAEHVPGNMGFIGTYNNEAIETE